MWLVRLLPGMGPPTETPKTGTGKNKIRIKPSTTLPPANVNAKTIVAVHREAITAFHKATGGRVDHIHALFCQIAEHNGKPPMPPQVMAAMLDLTPEDMKEQPCIASEVQLTAAFERMVKPQDSGENFKEKVMAVVEQQTKRSMHAINEMVKLRPVLTELHQACAGSAQSLYMFFMDLLPAEQQSQYTLQMWNALVMKCPPTTTKIPLEQFLDCFQDSMDYTDTADVIIPVAERHTGYAKNPGTAPKPKPVDPAAAAAAQAAAAAAAGRGRGPPAPPPPPPEAVKIVAEFESDISAYHDAIGGRVAQIHVLFNAIAEKNGKPPIPPPAIVSLLGLSMEEVRASPPKASKAQLITAMQRMVKPDDTAENFRTKVITMMIEQTARHVHAARQMDKIRPTLIELHEACAGSCKALFDFFMDLVPEESRPQLTLEVFNSMVLKVHPKTETIDVRHFTESFQDSLDPIDTADKIQPVLEKHIAKLRPAARTDSDGPQPAAADSADGAEAGGKDAEAAKAADSDAAVKEEGDSEP